MMAASLILISLVCGLGVAWIFRRTADRAAIRLARKRVHARLLEFRLYADEPRLIFRAQLALIEENFRLLRLLLPPALISVVPLAWITLQLDAVYGYRPLPVGEAAIVTAQMTDAVGTDDALSSLQVPPGISVETPPVRDFNDRQISWRVRAKQPLRGSLWLRLRGNLIEKNVAAGGEAILLSARRSHSLWEFLLHPEEPRLQSAGVAWVEVEYPKTGWWMLWFLVFSTAGAVVFGRYA
jgi:hypothetical protein